MPARFTCIVSRPFQVLLTGAELIGSRITSAGRPLGKKSLLLAQASALSSFQRGAEHRVCSAGLEASAILFLRLKKDCFLKSLMVLQVYLKTSFTDKWSISFEMQNR